MANTIKAGAVLGRPSPGSQTAEAGRSGESDPNKK